LNITNGDLVADLLRQASVPGDLLPWRDLLHEGPVQAGLSLEEMSRIRARFISADLDQRSFDQVLADFTARDGALKAFKRFDEVVLWFEHDLYDQLQLLQILSWFAPRELGRTRLSMICVDRFLSQLTPEQLARLAGERIEVTREHLDLAARGWVAFCAELPAALSALVDEDLTALPFLHDALVRHLQQYPWTQDGLSRTERQTLSAVGAGIDELGAVFRESQIEREESPFMGDRAFLFHLRSICGGRSNLVQFTDGDPFSADGALPQDDEIWKRRLQLTEIGRRIISGQADYVRLYGIDRWLGGVRLQGSHAAWRWDGKRGAIVAMSA
jgi:hypothetical protein